ncbi:tetratricopeptide repeat protein 14 homolog isoform X1 [Daktulosphaira vitifoliae]|uniref:tetratricopeptide repeat protein 14 homolog isoform X1 n=1 Tax=Daktulosphaira vitifoliae TaxID=58002 RepID=UPI0021AA5641|nr:tetratricopeptide repeat protein 14 homolog isoform X1 [Daktulosphaira vitifoliae]XP_050542450.1 tetratricopeptide repeat protein 14 homolog isoform X1 [Daktulosphaira vitifoliae]
MEVEMDTYLLASSLSYHGSKLQEMMENHTNSADLFTAQTNLNYSAYSNGHNSANDLEEEKQFKLGKFVANHSKAFFSVDLFSSNKQKHEILEKDSIVHMPPYETFGHINKELKLKHFLNELLEGDLVITSVASKTTSGLLLKILCTYSEPIRIVSDINARGFCTSSVQSFSVGDNICCEVLEVVPETCKLICGTKGIKCSKKYKNILGLFNMENCPQSFKLFHAGKNNESYDSMLKTSLGFKNPSNIVNLEQTTGLTCERHSIIPELCGSFSEKETALELRKTQSAQWAIQSVSDGIKYFKSGQHSEAFLCLNKALSIDSLNVEAYVARGALYANVSRFPKAVEDLKCAIKLDPKHVNGRKYLSETLMGYARTLESQNKLEEALQLYEECLQMMPDHDEAKTSIDYLKSILMIGGKTVSSNMINSLKKVDCGDFSKSGSSSSSSNESSSGSSESSSSESSSEDESSSSESDSNHSSSSSSSSGASSGNESPKVEKERSLSPFSKRLAMDSSNTNGGGLPCNPAFISPEISQQPPVSKEKENDIEGRIQKLLLLSQANKSKKGKKIGLDLKKLLQEAYEIKNEEKKNEKIKVKKIKDKKKSHKHKKKDSKSKHKNDKEKEHKKNKSKKNKYVDPVSENEQHNIIQKSDLPDPESVKSNLSNIKENIFFKKYVKQDKPEELHVLDKKDEQQYDIFEGQNNENLPSNLKYIEDPSLIPTPKFSMQLSNTTTSFTKPKKKETTDDAPPSYLWDNNRFSNTNESTKSQNIPEPIITELKYPTSVYDPSKALYSIPQPIMPDRAVDSTTKSYISPNKRDRSRSRSATKRHLSKSRSRSSGAHSNQSPFKKKPRDVSRSKTRSRSGSYPRHRRYSSSRSNRSRSSSRSYSRSRSRSRSNYHRNRQPYYNNRNRGTYYKPRFQNQNHHNRGFQHRGFQHRGGYMNRQNYNNNYNNWNNRGQRGGGRQRFFHYKPRQYDRNRYHERRSYSGSPIRRSRSRSKSRSKSRASSKEYNRKRYSNSVEDLNISNSKPKTPPEPDTSKWQNDNSNIDNNGNSHDHEEGSIE